MTQLHPASYQMAPLEMDFCQQAKLEAQETSRSGFALSASRLELEAEPTSVKATPISPSLSAAMTPADSFPPMSPSAGSSTKGDGNRAPQFVNHLPNAERLAYSTFQLMTDNVSLDRNLGCSHQSLDTMICDCQFDDPCQDERQACGALSQCINRLTQVECLRTECPTRDACQNQRFARKQYADIEIVQTEKKGFGLRAAANIGSDDFVYEYIGEIIPEDLFRDRIKEYADEGIQHFYFMMLQKGEYIDATKRGGIARFLNHSCEPNCYVAKWVVGRRMRMGIFAKRDILKGEELTFNYNVDRYGYDAQTCYCGENGCLGTIGGKTQTDIRILDPLYIEALGMYDNEEDSLKGHRRRKLRTIADIDLNVLRPMEFAEVQKVVTAIRQAANQVHKDVITRLLQRVTITSDVTVNRELMRLKGFLTMRRIFDIFDLDQEGDKAIMLSVLKTLDKWQPKWRNKIEECGIEEQLEMLLPRLSSDCQSLARQLVARWRGLPSHYEIPRINPSANATYRPLADEEVALEPRWKEESRPIEFALAPVVQSSQSLRSALRVIDSVNQIKASTPSGATEKARLESILAAATAQESQLGEFDTSRSDAARHAARGRSPSAHGEPEHRHKRSRTSAESKDRRLKRLLRELVIQSLSKYREQIDRDTFKKYAEQCTERLVEKEKRSKSYPFESYDSLSAEKTKKIHLFVKDFTRSLLQKLADRGKLLTRDHRPQDLHAPNSDHTSVSPGDEKYATDIVSPSPVDSQPSNSHVSRSTIMATMMDVYDVSQELQSTEQVADAAIYAPPASGHRHTGDHCNAGKGEA